MAEQEARDETNRLLGRIVADNENAKTARAEMRVSLDALRAEVRPLLDLPVRMSSLEAQTASNHATNVGKLSTVEGDIEVLKAWQMKRDGWYEGVRWFGHLLAALIGAGLGILGMRMPWLR